MRKLIVVGFLVVFAIIFFTIFRPSPSMKKYETMVTEKVTEDVQTVNDWENQSVIGRNKETARATAVPYASTANAMEGERSGSTYVQSLDGAWPSIKWP